MEENKWAAGAMDTSCRGEDISGCEASFDVPEVCAADEAVETAERLLEEYIEAFRYLAK